MGKHSEWRKIAKKARRKRVRQTQASLRCQTALKDQNRSERSPTYRVLLEKQAKEEQLRAEEEVRLAAERERTWKEVEEEAQKQWQQLQKKLIAAKEERARQNEQIILEWEKEQKRQKELKEKEERELQEKLKQQEILNDKVHYFIEHGGDTPEHLKTKLETNPNKQPCPFFQKTSACRFYDVCSRNHVRPGISRIILIPNFFSHYSLETAENEHGSDSSLEYENYETYNYYKEFFYDVITELETFGNIRVFKTCCNHEPHLRGNVYIEYATTRAALKCYRVLNGRWYAGKQLNAEFSNVVSWKTAICGLFFGKRCPKGNSCNFLHVFRNPKNLYNNYEEYYNSSSKHKNSNSDNASDRRNWRWSESPERLPITDLNESTTKVVRRRSRSRSWSKTKPIEDRQKKSHRDRKRYSKSRSRSPDARRLPRRSHKSRRSKS